MSDLRSEIANQVFDAIQGENDIEDASDAAERILAAFAKAMTSEDVMEAARLITWPQTSFSRDTWKNQIRAAFRAAGVKGEGE